MSRQRISTWLALIVLGVGALIVFILGLFAYMSLTATPLHPDAQSVPSVARSVPLPEWMRAVDESRRLVRAGVAKQNVPGVSVGVAVSGDVVWAEGFGWANLDDRIPVTPDTRFRIADVSIPLTSAAVGLLLENRKLRLDDEIQTYVPQFPKKKWPVTLRQVMGHLAGIRNDAGDEESLAPCERTQDGLQRFAERPLLFEPVTQYRFSSYGWILVSAAIESAGGRPFFTFMRRQIFEPLQMSATRPDSASEPIPDRATFYFPRFAGDTRYGPELVREGDYSCFAGAGAFLSTPSDMVRFGVAIDSGTLLEPATVELLQRPQRLASGADTGYGLGWKVETVPLAGKTARMLGHGTRRDFLGGTASLMMFPERGIVVAVTANTGFADTRSMALDVAQVFALQQTSPAAK